MNLLIVDDEIYVVRAIKNNIDWKSIGIDKVYTAFSVDKAKTLFRENEIEIVLTDIEMPRESGLDFMRWIRESGYDCKGICLTCHAEFDYAKEALSLGYMEYCVKPVDFGALKEVVHRAVREVQKKQQEKFFQSKGALWEDNKNVFEKLFWENLLTGKTEADPAQIIREAEKNQIPYAFDMPYQLILFAVRRKSEREELWKNDQAMMEFVFVNFALDIFLDQEPAGKVGWLEGYLWLILEENKTEGLRDKTEEFLSACANMAGTGVVAYYEKPCFGEQMKTEWEKLKGYDAQNVQVSEGIFSQRREEGSYIPADNQKLRSLLRRNAWEELRQSVCEEEKCAGYITREQLFLKVNMLLHEIYLYLEEKELDHKVFWTEKLRKAFLESYHSLENYYHWFRLCADRLQKLAEEASQEKEVSYKVKEYIRQNIETKLKRNDIAAAVNYSADYLTRVFKQETGISLSEYIAAQKMKRARELLEAGKENIGEIALTLGYNSFSYFSEIFKSQIGCLPSDYRKREQQEMSEKH